jgi:hypothetical protein
MYIVHLEPVKRPSRFLEALPKLLPYSTCGTSRLLMPMTLHGSLLMGNNVCVLPCTLDTCPRCKQRQATVITPTVREASQPWYQH